MALVRDTAICIRAWDWSQTSQMVVAFSREHGLLRGIAKGARRLGSNYAGGFEPLTRGDIVFSTAAWEKAASGREQASSGLVTITAWDVLELFPSGRTSLRNFLACCCMLDLVQRGMQEADPHPEVFDAFTATLRALAAGEMTAEQALASFTWTLLHETGHAPSLASNMLTNQTLEVAKVYAFYPRLGGFAPDTASREASTHDAQANSERGPAWRVRAETLLALRSLATPGLATSTMQPSTTQQSEAQAQQVWLRTASLLVQYFREVHQTDVPAVGEWLREAKQA
jgi:DNA repair protein RecO (recombination protein O)